MSERDTHFQVSAVCVLDKVDNILHGFLASPLVTASMYDEIHQIIANYAYDVVIHALRQVTIPSSPEQIIQSLDDVTEWPIEDVI